MGYYVISSEAIFVCYRKRLGEQIVVMGTLIFDYFKEQTECSHEGTTKEL